MKLMVSTRAVSPTVPSGGQCDDSSLQAEQQQTRYRETGYIARLPRLRRDKGQVGQPPCNGSIAPNHADREHADRVGIRITGFTLSNSDPSSMNKVSFTSEPYLSSVYTSGSGGMSGTRTMLVDVDSAASFIAKSSGDQRGAIGGRKERRW